uniref:Ribonuclease H-like domain-containing protein n=1 Tax=Tanacetum cinerariifolium TaxID=118510 RepID=A0A6L2MR91_TANCI|nr:ribonuclease H-like domain-containing protein [Tanacetum cinerariifolium]
MAAGDAPPQPPPNTDKIIPFSIPNKVPIKLDLEKHNYNSWSSFSLIHLGSLGLKSHVEDKTVSTNPDWCQLDDLIKMWILSSLCDSLQEQVVTTPGNAKALWDHLKDLFHINKDNRAINLDNELHFIKIGSMTVNAYCTKIRSMAGRLKNLGCDISDKNLVVYTVNGLDSHFATLVDIIRHRETLPSFETTNNMFLLKESSFKDDTRTSSTFDDSSSSPTALVSFTSSTPKGSSSKSPTLPQLCNHFNKGTCHFGDRCTYIHDHQNRVGLSSTRNQSRSTTASHAGVWNTAGIQHRASAPYVSSYRPSYNSTAGLTAFYTGPIHYSSQPHPLTRHILLRCDSSGDLYPVTKPSPLPTAFVTTSSSTWHQRLGHPGDDVLRTLSTHSVHFDPYSYYLPPTWPTTRHPYHSATALAGPTQSPSPTSTGPPQTHKMVTRSQSGIVKPLERFSLHTASISPILKTPFVALQNSYWRQAMLDEYNALIKNGTWILVPKPAGVNMRSLYGLKQAPRALFQRFAGYAIRAWFYHSRCNTSLFIYQQGSQVAYLLIYVDDIILTASSAALLQQIITSLHHEFNMTDLGALNYFHGISATRSSTGLFLSQKKYACEPLEHANMVNCNPSWTPVDTDSKLGPEGVAVQDPTLYRSLAGGLQYLTFTRPDLSYAVQQICLYMHDPREPHFAALKRILRYVRGTVDFGLQLYASATTSLVGYTDADWADCPSTRRSTFGYCVFLSDNLLSWSSKRQHTISRSSAEAEYRGVANVIAETAWLHNLLCELHSPLSTTTLICLYMHDPREPHFAALKRILRYVRGTVDFGLQLYASATTTLVGYTDADWADCPSIRRSTFGYYVFLGDNLLSWSSKRQHTISRSSAEAEYRGVANVVAETAWLHNLLRELHSPLSSTTLVYCDNDSVVYQFDNPVQYQLTKHIEIDIHFVHDMVQTGHIRVLHVPSRYQYADIFTKGLPTALFEDFRSSLSVQLPPAQTAGAY